MATVLLIEDHDDSREIFRTILEVHGHEVMEASDGEIGLELALEHRPELVVLDLGLPRMDGWEVLERIRSELDMSTTRVMIVTAHGGQENRIRAGDVLCNGFLVKPVEPLRLVAAAEDCLANGSIDPSNHG